MYLSLVIYILYRVRGRSKKMLVCDDGYVDSYLEMMAEVQ